MKGVYFDKQRDRWIARITVNSKRVLVGRFLSEERAKIALIAYRAKNALLVPESSMSGFETHDEGIKWLKPYRAWKRKRDAQRAIDKANESKLENM